MLKRHPVIIVGAVGPFSDLPNVDEAYRADPFIRAAVRLQGLGRDAAIKELLAYMQDSTHPNADDQVIVLCRMLFVQKPGGEFRRPGLGAPGFLGQTTLSDWPLEPVEIVDGVPFKIVIGYALAGYPEQGDWYLKYCVANCDWSSTLFKVASEEEKRAALDKLIESPKWKTKLTEDKKKFLSSQIQ